MDEAHGKIIRDETGAQKLVGYVVDVSGKDSSGNPCGSCWLDIEDKHRNRHGALHGGIMSMMLDNACGVTASLTVDQTGTTPFMTVSLQTNYLEGVKSGRVTAQGKLRRAGRSLVFVDGELYADDGRLIATATAIFKSVPKTKL